MDCQHDSLLPLGGAVPLVNMMYGEVSPGGTGSGMYGMLIFVLLAVFIAGLMVGRTPEYLGKKIQAAEMKLVVLYILFVPLVVLAFAGISAVSGFALNSLGNPGPHGLTEITYAFTSQANNNGSAFAGLTGDTQWYNITGAIAMLVGRFFLMVPVARDRRFARTQAARSRVGRNVPDGHATVHSAAVRRRDHRRRPDVLPGRVARPVVEHLTGKF